QYYNFLHLGFEGYRDVQSGSMDLAVYCHDQIGAMECFENFSTKVENPLFIWMMEEQYNKAAKWTLYDLQNRLQQNGWMIPAYTMPADIDDVIVMRVVVRQGMTRDMADMLLEDIRTAVSEFEALEYPTQTRLAYQKQEAQMGRVFMH
ncbi:MAG: glutamate decarboxylase, partial [Rikenellaceae bacterium]